jgi:DNA-binding winged helix-turn-helix (wHTH) protein
MSDVSRGAQPPAIFVGRGDELARLQAALERLRLAAIYGVPGVGKSALLLHAASSLAARKQARLVVRVCEDEESVSALAAAVLGRRPAGDPVDALARAALRGPLVLAIDDAQRASGLLIETVQHLAQLRLPLWILMASREALQLSTVAVDHAVVRLAPFNLEQSALLWRELSQVYGPPPVGLDQVAGAAAATPLRLKQAFAGPAAPCSDDPLGLEALGAPERALLAQLVAFRRPVPIEAATPAEGLNPLLVRFLVEQVNGRLTVHDLVRAAVRESRRPPGPPEHARALAWWRAHPADDEGSVEQLHHALQVGETEAALVILHRHSTDMVRIPPGVTVNDHHLAEALDELATRMELPEELRFLRALIRAHQGESQRAFDEIRPMVGQVRGALAFGALGVALGRRTEAVPPLERVRDAEDVSLPKRLMALGCLTGAYVFDGDLANAHRVIEGGAPLYAATGSLGAGSHAWLRALYLYESEEPAQAARALSIARAALAPLGEMIASLPLVDSIERLVHTLLGACPPEDTSTDLFREKPFFRHAARFLRLQELLACGHAHTAAGLGASLVDSSRAIGYTRIEHAALPFVIDAERTLGRLEAANRRLSVDTGDFTPRARVRLQAARARLLLQAGELGLARAEALAALPAARRAPGTRARLRATAALADAAAGGRARPPQAGRTATTWDQAHAALDCAEALLWQERPDEADRILAPLAEGGTAWRQVQARALLLRAEVALRTGDLAAASGRLSAARAEADENGWEVELIRAALLGASLARVRGEDARAQVLLGEALGRAEGAGLAVEAGCARVALGRARRLQVSDAGRRLATRLQLAEPLTFVLREPDGRYFLGAGHLAGVDRSTHHLFVDLVTRRVRVGHRTVDLGRRRTLIELLRSLSEHPGQVVSADKLTRAVWQLDYHPLRHHGRITMAVSRLRQLLGAGVVEADGEGYRLTAALSWAVLDRLSH